MIRLVKDEKEKAGPNTLELEKPELNNSLAFPFQSTEQYNAMRASCQEKRTANNKSVISNYKLVKSKVKRK